MTIKINVTKTMMTTTTEDDGGVGATKTTTSLGIRVLAVKPDNRGPVASNKPKLHDRSMTSLSSSASVAKDIRRDFNLLSPN